MIRNLISEPEAIKRAQQGDATGLGRLYELHRSRIYRLCLRYTTDSFDAEDLTQDVFIQVSRKVNTFRGESEFGSWLYKVALNFVRLHSRQRRRDDKFVLRHIPEDTLYSIHARACNPVQTVALTQALSNLSSLRRETVLLHDIAGLTHTEIARRTRATVIASKSRLHQAHVALRRILGKDPNTPKKQATL